MRLLLIRHGETEHNVAGLLAGVTNSRLTNHGLIQAQRLGTHLIKKRLLKFSQIFASDLQRALRTAEQICEVQNAEHGTGSVTPISLELLREQDFGSFELLRWNRAVDARQDDPSSADPNFKPKETAVAMKLRADTFLDDCLLPLRALDEESKQVVAVVSHGLFLAALWRALLLRFRPHTVTLKPDAIPPGLRKPLEYLPTWTKTGVLELEIASNTSLATQAPAAATSDALFASAEAVPLLDTTMAVLAINSKEHLLNLKRTRGGLGSSVSDDKQERLDNFFKKSKKTKGLRC